MPKKKGGRRDNITGLSKPTPGFGNLEEDRIYYNMAGWNENEGELSSDFYLLTRRNPGETRRFVWEGKFKYDNEGVMTSAKIKTSYFFKVSRDDGVQTIVARKAIPKRKDRKIKDIAGHSAWDSLDSEQRSVYYFVSIDGKTVDGSDGPITPFTRLGGGIFFPDYWWDIPFGQDLI